MIEDLAFIYWGATAWQRCHLGAFRPVTAEFLASRSWSKAFGTNLQLMSRKDNFFFLKLALKIIFFPRHYKQGHICKSGHIIIPMGILLPG